ncbi:lipopolysaccharide biosynthesis protein [Methylomonas sp. MgM2]
MAEIQNESLTKKSVRAVYWSSGEVFVRQFVRIAVSVLLARLLTPEEFGTVALLYIFADIAHTFIDSGFSVVVGQRRDLTRADESTMYWFSVCMSMTCASLLCLAAPYIAGFYDIEVLRYLVYAMALNIFVMALGSIHHPLLTKQLQLKKITIITSIALLASGTLAVWLAYRGFGVWALVFQQLLETTISTVLLWVASDWRPAFVFSFASLRRLFGFGGFLMLSSFLNIAYNRAYSVIVGKVYGVADLGFYNRADNARQIPQQALSIFLGRVAFPIFAAAAGDIEKVRRGMQYSIRGVMLINIPIMLGLMVTSEAVIRLLYGDQWLIAVPLLQILCLSGILMPLQLINLNAIKAFGKSKSFFKAELVKKSFGIVLLMCGLVYGITGLAWSQFVYSIFGFFVDAYFCGRYFNYGAWLQIKDVLPALLVSTVMAGLIYALGKYWDISYIPLFSLQVSSGIFLFVGLCHICKLKAYKELYALLIRRDSR